MEEKIYFAPGDLVQLRQNLPNKPIMMVVRKETALVKQKSEFSIENTTKEFISSVVSENLPHTNPCMRN